MLSNKLKKELSRQFQEEVSSSFDLNLTKKDKVELNQTDDGEYYKINDSIRLIKIKERLIPHLNFIKEENLGIPRVFVDRGAIKFVTNGADIMRPGITKIEENVLENKLCVVVEDLNEVPLAVGIALYDSVDMKAMDSGKVVKNIHYMSDSWWKLA